MKKILGIALISFCFAQLAWCQQPAAKSGVITKSTTRHRAKLSAKIDGARKLHLVVTDAGDGYSFDWSNWVNPKLLSQNKNAVSLTTLKWKSARSGWGQVQLNKNCDGNPLSIDREGFEKGIGTHANSIITYELPANHGYTRFESIVGLDNGGTDQGGGDQASVEFFVYVDQLPKNLEIPKRVGGPDHDSANAIEQFDLHPELEIGLFASEPMMLSPANMDIDHLGRIWITEVTNYRKFANRNNPFRDDGDRILILEDTDDDGKADRSTVFYQGTDIDSAHGICVLGNRVIVSALDKVFYLIDDDGDSKADRKEILFTGLSGAQHDHGIHAFVFGPDGKLYFNFGNAGKQICDKDGKLIVDMAGKKVHDRREPYQEGMVFRCNLDGSEFETLAWNFRNNWEVCVDSFGRLWQSDNDDDGNRGVRINFVMEHGNYGFRDETDGSGWRDYRIGMNEQIPLRHFHQNDPGVVPNLLQTGAGSPTGICVYEGNMLPKVFRGQMIHSDAGPNIVRSYPVTPSGVGFSAEIVNLMDGARYNKWFRPSDVCVAPDGSVFVADWYDPGVGGHRMGDTEHGRVYRLSTLGFGDKYTKVKCDFSTVDGAITALGSPNLATRYLAFEALQKMGVNAETGLANMFQGNDPRLRARALWLLTKLGLSVEQVKHYLSIALKDTDPNIAGTAVRCIRQLEDVNAARELFAQIDFANCSNEVRRECFVALSLRNKMQLTEDFETVFWELYDNADTTNKWLTEAAGIACNGRWDQVLNTLQTRLRLPDRKYTKLAWRSRGEKSPEIIANMIADQRRDVDQMPTLIRALDFLANQNSLQPVLESLIFESRITNYQKLNFVLPELLMRINSTDLDKNQIAMIDEFLDEKRDSVDFVRLIKKLRLKHRYEDLLEQAIVSDDRQLKYESMTALLDLGEEKQVADRLATANDETTPRLIEVLSLTNNGKAAQIMEQFLSLPNATLNQKKLAIGGMGKIQSGANTLLKWAEEKSFAADLQPAISAALHSSRWQNIANRGYELFPVSKAKDKPVPKINDLLRQRGDIARGKAVFEQAGTCAKCHVVAGKGIEVGPELTLIGQKLSPTAMYESILFPSAGIGAGFENWSVLTVDGETVQGILVSESNEEVQIKNKEGIVEKIRVDSIEAKKHQALSMMPDNLHEELTTQDLVDLVEYLKSLK